MRIANPIYDVVFKYLMEDRESAILLLSEIIGEDIAELAFHPQESTAEIAGRNRCITVYRLDFAAKIRLKEGGYRKVIIEIQKAKFSTDIMRFRRYLGEQYRNRENVYRDDNGNKKALPIISVYFLGHRLSGTERAVIKVQRSYYDGITEEKLSCREEFIESLTHDSFVVQIPSLQQPYRSRLEKLLSIFDQHRKVSDHILEINEDDYPEEYRQLVRRLIRAAAEKQVMDTMDAEDDILEELENMERTIEKKDKTIKEHREKLEEKDKVIAELQEQLKKIDKKETESMRIANPIYDVVFKYLMEDRESAILLLSEIIGEDIAELAFHPQESTAEIAGRNRCITVYRLDFAAKIRLKEGGYRKVIIEIQKAKFSTDIMRFRRYLGEQYRNRENVYRDDNGNKKALPIISVYFLGHRLSGTERAVIKVQRSYYDGITEEKLSCREEFIESLTHDSFVVQIPSLQQPYRSRLEKLLSIFDQHRKVSDHILEINEDDYPEEYRQLVRRLIRAAAEKQVMDTMDAEDDILEELENMERTIEEHRKKLEEKDKQLGEKDRIIRELMEKVKNQQ